MACTISLTERPNMQEFYAGKQIFVTGSTGFMGKCLLEKLLRSLQGLKRVIVLVRPKKEKTAKQRLDELLSSKVSTDLNFSGLQKSVWLRDLLPRPTFALHN